MKPLSESALRMMCAVWEHEPISTSRLCERLRECYGWQPSTSYTVLHRLVDAELLQTEGHTVTATVSQKELGEAEIALRTLPFFCGDLERLLDAALTGKTLTDKEARALKRVIDRHRIGKGKEEV